MSEDQSQRLPGAGQMARIGRLLGDPARAAMLMSLMDGRALTAGELARAAGVTPQTASAHLARLSEAQLLTMVRSGRHRYHRLAGPEVASLLEGVVGFGSTVRPAAGPIVTGPRDRAMRTARTCYDHFAGRLGVALADALVAAGRVELHDEAALITPQGVAWFEDQGILVAGAAAGSSGQPSSRASGGSSGRPLCRPCLDWSERRPHLGGALGAALCRYFFANDLVRRQRAGRAVQVTAGGRRVLLETFGVRSLE